MSFDSLFAYRQSIGGVETSISPPMHAYLFFLSRTLTGGPGGIFAAQTFALFFGAATVIGLFSVSRLRQAMGFVLFVGSLFAFPTLLGTAIVNWKDVPLTSFGLVAIAFWLMAVRSTSRAMLALAALSLTVALPVRLNALPLLLPLLALMIVQPIGDRPRGGRATTALGLVLGLTLAYATSVWRLPDLRRLPAPGHLLATVQLWDLIGISVCAGTNLMPPEYGGGDALTVAQLRAIYDPRHVNLTLSNHAPDGKALPNPPGGPSAKVERVWKAAIRSHPRCYLHHRTLVFRQQMGLAERVFYPTHSGIDENLYGIAFRYPKAAAARIHFVTSGADAWSRRPFWLYILAAAAITVALVRRMPAAPVVLILGLGALLYVASLFFLAPAADARYLFPSSAFCGLLSVLVLTSLGERRNLHENDAGAS